MEVLFLLLFLYLLVYMQKTYDELRQGPGPDLGPRLNGYGDRTIMGTGHYGDLLISGPAIIGTGSLVACNDRSGPENDTPGPETRGAVPKMIPPVPKREERSRFFFNSSDDKYKYNVCSFVV